MRDAQANVDMLEVQNLGRRQRLKTVVGILVFIITFWALLWFLGYWLAGPLVFCFVASYGLRWVLGRRAGPKNAHALLVPAAFRGPDRFFRWVDLFLLSYLLLIPSPSVSRGWHAIPWVLGLMFVLGLQYAQVILLGKAGRKFWNRGYAWGQFNRKLELTLAWVLGSSVVVGGILVFILIHVLGRKVGSFLIKSLREDAGVDLVGRTIILVSALILVVLCRVVSYLIHEWADRRGFLRALDGYRNAAAYGREGASLGHLRGHLEHEPDPRKVLMGIASSDMTNCRETHPHAPKGVRHARILDTVAATLRGDKPGTANEGSEVGKDVPTEDVDLILEVAGGLYAYRMLAKASSGFLGTLTVLTDRPLFDKDALVASRVRIDLSGMSLTGQSLDSAFRKVPGVVFELPEARLDHTRFSKAFLAGAVFRKAMMEEVEFEDCDLTGADFSSVKARNLKFRNCALDGARFDDAQMEGLRIVSSDAQCTCWERATLAQAGFERVELEGSVFRFAVLSHVLFPGSRLSGCDFREARLEEPESAGEEPWVEGRLLKIHPDGSLDLVGSGQLVGRVASLPSERGEILARLLKRVRHDYEYLDWSGMELELAVYKQRQSLRDQM